MSEHLYEPFVTMKSHMMIRLRIKKSVSQGSEQNKGEAQEETNTLQRESKHKCGNPHM
jgi:hypothetical protein